MDHPLKITQLFIFLKKCVTYFYYVLAS